MRIKCRGTPQASARSVVNGRRPRVGPLGEECHQRAPSAGWAAYCLVRLAALPLGIPDTVNGGMRPQTLGNQQPAAVMLVHSFRETARVAFQHPRILAPQQFLVPGLRQRLQFMIQRGTGIADQRATHHVPCANNELSQACRDQVGMVA
jgi:hypothetical protein